MKNRTLIKSIALFLSWLTLSPLLLILDGRWKLLPKGLRIVLFVLSDSFEPGKYSYSAIWGNGMEAPKGESDKDDIDFSIAIERGSKTFHVRVMEWGDFRRWSAG